MRLGSAVLVTVFSIALIVASPQGGIPWILAALGFLISIGWFFAWRSQRKRAPQTTQWRIDLDREAFILVQQGPPVELRWEAIRSIDVDEERLEVAIQPEVGEKIAIAPGWDGLGLYDLHSLFETYRRGAIE